MTTPSKELIDSLYQEEVAKARAMPLEEKVMAGPKLFDYACEITKAGIRMQHPEADEAEVRRILEERLALAKRLENLPWRAMKP